MLRSISVYRHAVVITPVARWALIARGTAYSNRFPVPSGCGLPHLHARSATTLDVSRPAQRSLAITACRLAESPKRPVCLEGSDGFVSSPRRFDSYRLERPSCRVGFAPTEDQHLLHGAHYGVPTTHPGLDAMSVSFSPDGQSLATGYGAYNGEQVGRVKVWHVGSGKEIKSFTGPKGGVNKVAFHPDGKRLAVAGSEVVEVWDLETGRKHHDLKGHKKWVYCAAYSPDGKWLATGAWDGTVKLRDAATGVAALTIFAHEGLRPEPRLQPRQPQPRHDERGPERQALGGSYRPAFGDVSWAHRLRPGGRFPARRPRGRHGELGWVHPLLGLEDQPTGRRRTHRLGRWLRFPARRPTGPLRDLALWERRRAPQRAGTLSPVNSTPRWRASSMQPCPRNFVPGSRYQPQMAARVPTAS